MTQQQNVRQGHPYLMYDAIMRQPEAMDEMLAKHTNTVQPVAAELAKKRRVYLVGIGTSWHAALVAGLTPRDAGLGVTAGLTWVFRAFEVP